MKPPVVPDAKPEASLSSPPQLPHSSHFLPLPPAGIESSNLISSTRFPIQGTGECEEAAHSYCGHHTLRPVGQFCSVLFDQLNPVQQLLLGLSTMPNVFLLKKKKIRPGVISNVLPPLSTVTSTLQISDVYLIYGKLLTAVKARAQTSKLGI